ncbi:MAG: protoglobin domain-containing protein [Methylacidiphilaceae bacterium]|nr:protoglobin domain-containing protein [Candidatus Methylacidiphilaceae bacterium]
MSSSLAEITESILAQLPPCTRFSNEDEALLLRLAPALAPLEDLLAKGFYDALFAHPETASVFGSGERAEREMALRRWWRRTLQGPFDARYWEYQAAVGLIHIRRGVTNPMMLAMWGWILNALQEALIERVKLAPQEVARAMEALYRLAATVQALTAESYLRHYLLALSHSTGVSTDLIHRLVSVEVAALDPSAQG